MLRYDGVSIYLFTRNPTNKACREVPSSTESLGERQSGRPQSSTASLPAYRSASRWWVSCEMTRGQIISKFLTVSKLDQESTSLEVSLLKEGVAKLSPGEQSTATQNSLYLQSNVTNGAAILAVARSSNRLEAPISEVEETVLLLLQEDVPLTHSVSPK